MITRREDGTIAYAFSGPDAMNVIVTLDGVTLDHCFAANADEGWAKVNDVERWNAMTPHERKTFDESFLPEKTLYGVVTISERV